MKRLAIAILFSALLASSLALLADEGAAPRVIKVAAEGVKGRDADFIGVKGLQEAVRSIPDGARPGEYEIRLSGIFRPKLDDYVDFKIDKQKVVIPEKSNLTISGSKRDEDGVVAELPPDLDISYRSYNILASSVSMTLRNLSLKAKNIRYPLHIYGGSAPDKTFALENCVVRHEGNSGKALEGWPYPRPFGVGLASGFKFVVRDCDIYSESIAPVNHGTNTPFAKPASVLYENCRFEMGKGLDSLIWLYAQGSGKINSITLTGLKGSGSIGVGEGVWTPGGLSAQLADHNEFEITLPDSDPLPYGYACKGRALKIESKSTGKGSSVGFDEKSGAFPLLVGNPDEKAESVDRYGFQRQYGYSSRGGGDGLPAFAVGSLSLQEDALKFHKGVYISSMGRRLGDCSKSPKRLGIVVDGKRYEVVFAKDYDGRGPKEPPKISNAEIAAEIEAVVGGVAKVSFVDPGAEYYPSFKGLRKMSNADETAVLSGMGVLFVSPGSFRKARAADGKIDGLCLDDGRVGDQCRVIVSGELWAQARKGVRFFARESFPATRNPGDELGISPSEPGIFEAKAKPAFLKAVRKDVLAFAK